MSEASKIKTVYDRFDLTAIIQKEFPNTAVDASYDLLYARLERDYVVNVFAKKFRNLLIEERGTTQWATAFDCDKFARMAAPYFAFGHGNAQKFNTDTPEGITFGVLCYKIGGDPARGHCVNVVITEYGVEVWEPQTQRFFTLNEAERLSVYRVEF